MEYVLCSGWWILQFCYWIRGTFHPVKGLRTIEICDRWGLPTIFCSRQVPPVYTCVQCTKVSWIFRRLPRCSKHPISNPNSQPDLRGEINTQNKNKGKINNCGFDPMKTASLLLTKTCLSKSEGYSKIRLELNLVLLHSFPYECRTCLLQQSFWPVFKKLHWRNWNLSGNLKPSFLTFFQPGSNRPKWRMWTTCGSWAPKIPRIPALLPHSLWANNRFCHSLAPTKDVKLNDTGKARARLEEHRF